VYDRTVQSTPPDARAREADASGVLVGERIGFREPWLDLLALPVVLFAALLLSSTTFGRLIAVPVQIQFHELGHALVAWLSSRAALPLPFGFTFWREESSTFTGLCVLSLLAFLFVRADRERRPFAVFVSGALIVAWVFVTFVVSSQRSLVWIIAGGVAGEFVLTSLAMTAFFFPMPDRLRWDFFRFLVLPPAALAWVSSTRLWVAVARGKQALPLGSILGSAGDMSGDLDRLIAEHGFTPGGIARGYLLVCLGSGVLWFATYAFFALPALRAITSKR
jgi:hypothetical protein